MVRNGPGMAIMVLSWRIRYVYHMCSATSFEWWNIKYAWMSSGCDPDLWDDETPRDAVYEEMSCWHD